MIFEGRGAPACIRVPQETAPACPASRGRRHFDRPTQLPMPAGAVAAVGGPPGLGLPAWQLLRRPQGPNLAAPAPGPGRPGGCVQSPVSVELPRRLSVAWPNLRAPAILYDVGRLGACEVQSKTWGKLKCKGKQSHGRAAPSQGARGGASSADRAPAGT